MRTAGLLLLLTLLACGEEPKPDRGGTPRSFSVDAPPGISGRVVDDAGKPVADAEVRIKIPHKAGYRGWKEGLATRTDAGGAFHLDVDAGLAPSEETEVLVYVRKKGIVPFLDRIPSYRPGVARKITARVIRAGRVVGRVVREDGAPAAGALVYALEDGRSGVEREDATPGDRAGEDGTFEIDEVAPGLWQIGARATGTRPAVVGPVEVALEGPAKAPDLILTPGGSIRGIAVTPDGEPVPRCEVTAYLDPDHASLRLFGLDCFEKAGGTAVTDAEGRFEITGLAPAEHTISVAAMGHSLAGPEPTGIRPGPDELRLLLQPGAELVIRVADAKTKKDLPFFVVAITWPESEGGKGLLSATLEAEDGVLRTRVLMNTVVRLEVSAPGYAVGSRSFRFDDPGPHEFNFGLPPR